MGLCSVHLCMISRNCELFQVVQRPSKILGLWTVSRCPEIMQDHGTVNRSKMSSDQLNLIWKKMDMGMGWTQKWNRHGNSPQPSLCHAKAILSTGIGVDSSEARINGQTITPVRTQSGLRVAQHGLRPCLYTNWWRNVGTLKLVIIWVSSSHASSFSGVSLTFEHSFLGSFDPLRWFYANMLH